MVGKTQGGHIPGSINVPSSTFSHAVSDLVLKLRDKDEVIFHCLHSQQRGPMCASIFQKEVEYELKYKPHRPKVSVLEGGFHNWVTEYRSQAHVMIESYDARYWPS